MLPQRYVNEPCPRGHPPKAAAHATTAPSCSASFRAPTALPTLVAVLGVVVAAWGATVVAGRVVVGPAMQRLVVQK